MKDFIIYLKLSLTTFFRRPSLRTLYSCLRYAASWRKYNKGDRNSVSEKMPWMSFAVNAYLEKIGRSDMRVFEYGSGGSTLFWFSRVKSVVSVEHDRSWYENMRKELSGPAYSHVDYFLAEAEDDPEFDKKDFRDPDAFISSDEHYKGMKFEKYVRTIERYPEGYFDIIVVDGRARNACIRYSIDRLKKGGILVVDNTERGYYLAPFRWDRKDWTVRTFNGPVPFSRDFSETTVITKLS